MSAYVLYQVGLNWIKAWSDLVLCAWATKPDGNQTSVSYESRTRYQISNTTGLGVCHSVLTFLIFCWLIVCPFLLFPPRLMRWLRGEERKGFPKALPSKWKKVRVIHSIIISRRRYKGVPDLASPRDGL